LVLKDIRGKGIVILVFGLLNDPDDAFHEETVNIMGTNPASLE
jgi:hypothetical protein